MSSPKEALHDPLKAWKFMGSPSVKPKDVFSLFMKAILLLFFVLTISLFFLYTFSNQLQIQSCPSCPPCDKLLDHRKFTNNNFNGTRDHPVKNITITAASNNPVKNTNTTTTASNNLVGNITAGINLVKNITASFVKENITENYHGKNMSSTNNNHENITSTSKIQEEKTNVSHIFFGIGGTAKIWPERRHYSDLWWKPNITRGFVWLDEKPPANYAWPETSPQYKVSADTSRFKYTCWYGSRSAIRIARIIKETFELGLKNVRWFVMGDDDTVFFVENLVTVLAKYDHNEMYYIGGNSESVEQDLIHSYTMAYGGGGFAISYPLAAELVKVLDGCIDRYSVMYGSDQKVQGCMAEIGIPVTKELGFHQIDIRGSPYGLLAAHPVAPLVSLHHLDYVEPIFPTLNRLDSLKKLISAYKMDPDRTLQHSFCYDLSRNWSLSVSWGYTIQLYPSLVTAKTLETAYSTYKTWRSWSKDPFTFNTQPMSTDPCKRPVVYFLDRVDSSETGLGKGKDENLTTFTRYVKYVNNWDPKYKDCERKDYLPALTVQIFNVSASTLKSDVWRKAPRRQCCEIINPGKGISSTMDIKIRSCNAFESVTPPYPTVIFKK